MEYLSQKDYSNAKRRLTKAENALQRAEGVEGKIKAAERLYHEAVDTMRLWSAEGYCYPDDWHRWQRAANDAEMTILRLDRW